MRLLGAVVQPLRRALALRRALRLFTSFALLALAGRADGQELDLDAFARYAESSLDAYEVPGAAIAVVKDGELVLARGFGVRHLGRPEPVDADTRFAIASNTKAFTAAVLASLVDDGVLHWDTRAEDALPGFRLSDPYRSREATIRDLLSHRLGFDSGDGDLLWLRSSYPRREIVRRLRFLEPAKGFRSGYGYQNVMFIAAGELAAAAAATGWDALIEERIFTPLGMSSSTTTIRDRAPNDNWATPHVRIDGVVTAIEPENVDNLGGAGAINSTANDLSRWLTLLLGQGAVDGVRVYSEEQSRQMWTAHVSLPIGPPSARLAARHPRFAAYGLGWRLRDYRGRKIAHHGGGLAGMTSLTLLVPEEELGIVVLTNQETSVQTALAYWIADRYLGAPETDWTALQREDAEERWSRRIAPRIQAVEASRVSGTAPGLDLGAYAGTYEDVLYGEARVALRDGSLEIALGASPPFRAPLAHWHYDTFVARFDHHSIADAFVSFTLGRDGRVHGMSWKPYSPTADSSYDYRNLRFERLP